MTIISGRQVEIGIGIEATAGTPVAATNYFKWDNFSMQAMSDKGTLKSARGIRNEISNSIILKQYGKGSIEFSPTVDMIPYALRLAMGTIASGAHSGEAAVYDHTVTVQNAHASMKTATFIVKQGGTQIERYANCVVDTLDLEIGTELAVCKLGLLGQFPTTGALTASYTKDTLFSRNIMFATFGTTLTTAASTAAFTTLTSNATNPTAGDSITIGNLKYTFIATALSNNGYTPYEILIGATASATLDNIKSAINGTTGAGTVYGIGTVKHPQVIATTKAPTTLLVTAIAAGTGGNSIATTVAGTGATLSWTSTVMASGSGNNPTPLSNFSLNINNNVQFEEAFLSGSAQPGAGAFIAGKLNVTGSYTLMFTDVAEYEKYKQNTKSALIVNFFGALLGTVPTQEQIQIKLGRLLLTKPPIVYSLDGVTQVKQDFEVEYEATDKEIQALVVNDYAGTNYAA